MISKSANDFLLISLPGCRDTLTQHESALVLFHDTDGGAQAHLKPLLSTEPQPRTTEALWHSHPRPAGI